VLNAAFIDLQIAGQSAVALLRVRAYQGVGPLAGEGLHEPFSVAVSAGPVRACADVPKAQGAEGLGKGHVNIGGSFVADHPQELESQAVEPSDGPAEKADHRLLQILRQCLEMGAASGVINSHGRHKSAPSGGHQW
jgi:hypothetical protein